VTDGLALGRYQTMARCVGDQRVLIARLTTRYSRAFALHEMMRERNRIRTAPRSAHARNRIRTSPQAHTDNEREREKRKKNTSGPVETVLTHRFRFLYSELSLSLPSSQREQVQAHDIYRDDILLLPTPTQELT
jgi:hypothetical protein